MDQEDSSNGQSVVISPSPPRESESGGAPVKPWGVAAFVVAIVPVYSYLFSVWDKSELPYETFTHWLYWLLLGCVGAFGLAWAMFLTRKKRNAVDALIIVGLGMCALCAFSRSLFVARNSIPPDNQYTVTIFKFAGATDSTKNAAENLRQEIIHELRKEFGERFAADRPREVKGEKQDQNLDYLRKWARRGEGSHLAVWVDMRVDSDGQHYVGTAYYLKATSFGRQINSDEIGVFGESGWWSQSFSIMPAGPEKTVGQEQIKSFIRSIELCRELANFQRGDYDGALSAVPDGAASAEYIAGRAAYEKALHSREALQLSEEAIGHLHTAIDYHGDESPGGIFIERDDLITAISYHELGKSYFFQLISGRGHNSNVANEAIAAFHRAGEIYRAIQRFEEYADELSREANCLLELSKLDAGAVAIGDLKRARTALEEAFKYLKPNSWKYGLAKKISASVFYTDGEYEQSISDDTEALKVFTEQADSFETSVTLSSLGTSQARRGISRGDESQFNDGVANLKKVASECQALALLLCYQAHWYTGSAELSWAKHANRGSLRWTTSLDIASKEYNLAENFLSKKEQPESYAELKGKKAEVYTERALGEVAVEGLPVHHLESALGELGAGIEALTQAGVNPTNLYKVRAECYRRLANYSSSAAEKQKYRKLKQEDEKRSN